MRVLLIGHLGQLGTDLRQAFGREELTLAGRNELPVQDAARVESAVEACRPDVILNCAAYHRVDDCEDHAEEAFAVNVFGVANLARAARRVDAVLVHFSTDYVFDAPRRTPYVESDVPCPKCVYGVSKAAGELMLQSLWPKHFVCRVSGLYGRAGSREKGTNFVKTMLGLAKNGKSIRVVTDQVLTPTSTSDVAAAVRRLVATDHFGLYHLTNDGECSWFEFAQAIFHYAGLSPELCPTTSDEFPMKARRPAYSVLDNARLRSAGFGEMPHWRDALERYVTAPQAA